MLIPEQFAETPVYDLLLAGAKGQVGVDRRWLHAIIDRGEAAIPDINRFGEERLDEFPVNLDEVIFTILRHLRSPASVPFFIAYLGKYGSDVPDELIDAILPIREAAFEPLLELYEQLEEDESAEVAFCLAAFRIRDDRVLNILTDRLEYDLTDGAICLGLYGDPAARPALERMMAETDDPHLINQLQQAIEDLGKDRPLVEEPFDIWEEIPERAEPETDALGERDLIEMLGSRDADYRRAAADGFSEELSETARKALLEHARTDEDEEVRASCWAALGSAVTEDKQIFKALLEKAGDESAPDVERSGALVGVGPVADDSTVRPVVERCYENPQLRAAALKAMWESLDRGYARFFPGHIDDPDPAVQEQAIVGVGHLGIHDSAERLRKFFSHDDLRPVAVFSYALAVRAEVSPARVRSILRRVEDAAGGLSEEEEHLVEVALDQRLLLNGFKPVFRTGDENPEPEEQPASGKVGRNDPCPCGSGKKYKRCCGA